MAAVGARSARRHPSVGRELGLVLLLAEDTRIALALLNRGRYLVLRQAFGIGPAEANLVTFAAAVGLADLARQRTAWLRSPGAPSPLGFAMGTAATRTAIAAVTGPSSPGTLSAEMLVALAILHRLTAPGAAGLRGVLAAPWRFRRVIAGQAERLQARAGNGARPNTAH